MHCCKALVLLLLGLFVSGGFFGCARAEGMLTVSFLNVGKADAILLRTENSAVLIDAGTNKVGDDIVDYLRAQGVEALDALIITHYDKDHVGGADAVVEALPVRRALNPAYAKDGKQYEQYIAALRDAGVAPEFLRENLAFELDGLRFEIDVANEDDYGEDEENDFSLVVRVTDGACAFLFAGDAENPRLGELLAEGGLAADVLKVPHHGSAGGVDPELLEAVDPDIALVSVGAGNRYGHPTDETLGLLGECGARVYRTDLDGDVVCRFDPMGTTVTTQR